MNKVELDYEGMGTCISADIKLNGTRIANIGATHPETNDIVSEVLEVVKQHLSKRKKIKLEIEDG